MWKGQIRSCRCTDFLSLTWLYSTSYQIIKNWLKRVSTGPSTLGKNEILPVIGPLTYHTKYTYYTVHRSCVNTSTNCFVKMMELGNNLCCEFGKHHICFRLEDISFLYEYLPMGFTSLDHFVTMVFTCMYDSHFLAASLIHSFCHVERGSMLSIKLIYPLSIKLHNVHS